MKKSAPEVYWRRNTAPSTLSPFQGSPHHIDVAVVGGGIVGLLTALRLSEEGRRVVLLEARTVGDGVTARSTAKVSALHETKLSEIADKHDEEAAATYGRLNREAVHQLEGILQRHGIDCDWQRQDAYTFAETEDKVEELRREARLARKFGLPCDFVTETPLPFPVHGAVKMDRCASFQPVKFLQGLLERLLHSGVQVYEQSRVTSLDAGDTITISANGHQLRADWLVLATHVPILDRALFFARVFPYRAYLIAARCEDVLSGMYVNAESPTHSVRSAGEYLVFAGYGHKVGEESDPWSRYEALEGWARQHFCISPVQYRWSTQDLFSADKLPMVGQALSNNERLLVATGFAGWGLSNGVVASRLLADTVQGVEPSEGHRLLTPLRFQTSGAGELLKENLEAGAHFVLDRITPAEKSEQLQPGEGAIVDDGLKKVAVYRDPDGTLSSFSATCPHLGCIVTWNEAEKSFDCPCHGSRFNHRGEVLNGPAVRPLKEM